MDRIEGRTETWRAIPGFEEYAASDRGRVMRLETSRILKMRRGVDGRLMVDLSVKGAKHTVLVHQLVMMAFYRRFTRGEKVRHLDKDLSNNRLSNLTWGEGG